MFGSRDDRENHRRDRNQRGDARFVLRVDVPEQVIDRAGFFARLAERGVKVELAVGSALTTGS